MVYNSNMRHLKIIILPLALILLAVLSSASPAQSFCKKFPAQLVKGSGPLPYNYRIIDGHIHAGGHPLNPASDLRNSDAQANSILSYFKSQGVAVIVDLENTKRIRNRYIKLLKSADIKRIHVPMHSSKVPSKAEWREIKSAMEDPVYIHCTYGADRTGAVIARYLVEEKGYSPQEAYDAAITAGSHSGILGGLKTGEKYKNLKKFIWDGP